MEEALEKLDAFFNPRAVAVIGATKKVDKAGHVIFKNFSTSKLRGVFKGELYPVNPNEDSILGFKCYKSLSDIPSDVDLIVIIVPATVVPSVMEEAGAKHVKACVIISAGFKEVGNVELEEQVVAIAKKYGIRVLGPNCLGVYYSRTGVDTLFLPETKTLTTGDEVVATFLPDRREIEAHVENSNMSPYLHPDSGGTEYPDGRTEVPRGGGSRPGRAGWSK